MKHLVDVDLVRTVDERVKQFQCFCIDPRRKLALLFLLVAGESSDRTATFELNQSLTKNLVTL